MKKLLTILKNAGFSVKQERNYLIVALNRHLPTSEVIDFLPDDYKCSPWYGKVKITKLTENEIFQNALNYDCDNLDIETATNQVEQYGLIGTR